MIIKGVTIITCDLCSYEKAYRDSKDYVNEFITVTIMAPERSKDICKRCANLVMNTLIKPKTSA